MPPILAPILVPAGIMGAALFVSWGLWMRAGRFTAGHWGGAIGFAGAYFATYVLLKSWPGMPPERADDWQAWSVVALGAMGVAQRWWGGKWFVAVPMRVAVSGGMLALLLRSQIEYNWDGAERWLWLGGLTAAVAAQWQSLETLASRRAGASLPLSLWALCAIAGATFAAAGSAFFGQLAGGLAAAFGAALVLAWWAPGLTLSGGAMAVFAPLYCGLVARGYFHAELPVYSTAVLYLAPFALWWGEERRVLYQRPWKGVLVRAGVVAAPAAVALLIAYLMVFRAAEDGGYAY